ncbi:MAG: hypothetical protein HOV79_21030 [Hamadaea sp.]|nr:hypothetical protein [Hamadaea sp.]
MKSRLARRRIAFVAMSAMTIVLLGPALPANATNYSGTTGDTGCTGLNEADNGSHYFHYVDLSDHMTNATDWARTNNINPTDVNTYYDSTLDNLTDVVVRDQHYVDYCGKDWMQVPGDGGVVGAAFCDRLNSADECEQHTVRYNLNFTGGTSTDNRRGLACHEQGHALGLAHRDGSCMEQGYPKPTLNYSSHDRDHLNGNY